MPRALPALLLLLAAGSASAQGIAPGGPVGGSTGIGSGLGGVVGGTGPSYPNGTTAPATPTAIPPGGLPPVGHFDSARPSLSTPSVPAAPSRYLQSQEPFSTPLPQPREAAGSTAVAAPVLRLPALSGADTAFLDGCWHTDLFRYGEAKTAGVTTYCFDGKGSGRLLYRRVSDASYFCRGPAEATYDGQTLHITHPDTGCTESDRAFPTALDCASANDGTAECRGQAWTVRLHYVGARAAAR
jgi:hypothetical protein